MARTFLSTFFFVGMFTILLVKVKSQVLSDSSQEYLSSNDDYDFYCANSDLELKLTGVQMKTLRKHFLRSPKLSCLSLQNIGINTLENSAFENVPNLEYLDLSKNNIYLNDLFSLNFTHLKVLDASSNTPINNYYDRTIKLSINRSLPSIRKLFLNSCSISDIYIDPQVKLSSLDRLDLSDNKLYSVDSGWLPMSLKYLNLQGNRLQSLNLRNLPNLKWLLLGNSPNFEINSFSLENLHSLKNLSIPSNGLTEISSVALINVSNLMHLDFSNNKIRDIGRGAFEHLHKLVHLNLSSNRLEFLEYGILDKLIDLRYLNLEKNNMKVFTRFDNETKLETLHLNCNMLSSLVSHVFANMPKLESLYLHGNQIFKIESGAFFGLESLKVLTLSNNKLSHLSKDWMIGLTNIESLDLFGNSILRLQDLSLSKHTPLQNLYLSKELKSIDFRYLIDVPQNLTIHLNSTLIVEFCKSPRELPGNYY